MSKLLVPRPHRQRESMVSAMRLNRNESLRIILRNTRTREPYSPFAWILTTDLYCLLLFAQNA